MDCFGTFSLSIHVCGVNNCCCRQIWTLLIYVVLKKRSWGSLKVLEKSWNSFVSKRLGTLNFQDSSVHARLVLQVVIGNILETRKTEVVVVTAGEEKWIRIGNSTTDEIEKLIVDELILRHSAHASSL